MHRRKANKILKRARETERIALRRVDWRRLVPQLLQVAEGFAVFLEMRDGRLVTAQGVPEDEADMDVISIALTPAGPNVAPRDTEASARELAATLSARFGVRVPVLVNRDPASFVGYYARVRVSLPNVH